VTELPKPSPVTLKPGESVSFGEYVIKVYEGVLKGAFVFNKELLKMPLTARPRREGDVLFFNNKNKSLKKLMIEKKIPKEKRDIIPVLCDNNRVIAAAETGMDKSLRAGSEENALSVIVERR
ncbi:MAG: tRNA lysidine(34) synthetase TilS, partial [Clostridia bacterium]|nr:tRNA lysidine(34) synthetase TilS [Clostridia bacterium]